MALGLVDRMNTSKDVKVGDNVIKDIEKVTKECFSHVKIVIPFEQKRANKVKIQQMVELTKKHEKLIIKHNASDLAMDKTEES